MPDFTAYARQPVPIVVAQYLVRFFYIALLFISMLLFPDWWDTSFVTQSTIAPFWPTSWVPLVNPTLAVYAIRLLFIFGATAAAIFPENRLARIFAFLGLIEFVSLYMSFWKIDADFYPWVAVSFLLIFLPSLKEVDVNDVESKAKFLLALWASQTIIVLGYTMGAVGKIVHSIPAFWYGQAHSFSIDAAALHIADRLLTTNSTSVFGPMVIEYPLLGWPFFVGAIYLMFFAILTSFRLPLQRLVGIGLILYHIAAYLTMNIGFTANVLLIAILFLNSPFRDSRISWREILAQVPLLGWIMK